jgi:DNA polymerase III delta prime subunit
MTPDEVVKELEILNQLTNIEWYGKEREAIRSAISLLQDYQKLRERISMENIAKILEGRNLFGGKMKEEASQAIVTYLQQPTEH